jgi:dihydroorotase
MNRRQFVWTAASAATLARIPNAFAAGKYDLVIKGARVVDPSRKLDAMRDIGIAGDKIAAVQAEIDPAGAKVIEARGKLVVPGLIDIHTHAARTADAAGSTRARKVPTTLATLLPLQKPHHNPPAF